MEGGQGLLERGKGWKGLAGWIWRTEKLGSSEFTGFVGEKWRV